MGLICVRFVPVWLDLSWLERQWHCQTFQSIPSIYRPMFASLALQRIVCRELNLGCLVLIDPKNLNVMQWLCHCSWLMRSPLLTRRCWHSVVGAAVASPGHFLWLPAHYAIRVESVCHFQLWRCKLKKKNGIWLVQWGNFFLSLKQQVLFPLQMFFFILRFLFIPPTSSQVRVIRFPFARISKQIQFASISTLVVNFHR